MPAPVALLIAGLVFLLATPLTQQHEYIPFSYVGSTGPNKWGSLNQQFSVCSTGKQQSPVNIVKDEVVYNPKLQPLIRYYSSANATLINRGFQIGLLYGHGVGVLDIDGKSYNLLQMHWHSPSEHTIDGVRHAAELHLVHAADDGSLAVVAILYKYGDPDPILFQLKGYINELAKEICAGDEEAHIPISLVRTKQIKRSTRKYYRYVGSLTTPPCTENVIWTILGKVREISKEQVHNLTALLEPGYKNNSRPVQPLNGRKIYLYNEKHKN
ncbi:PREDICTED: alpha carbonic anhydrase 1, chloroplastic [Nelumbo nucifera]|uniref:Carbonic anhydrase n=1 Tax=Nelumbo nucifera TaxID=4432 RepID=A0A1U7YZH9_NELNU|nr:PREDICTED: alpha carbonic anhydrase 1, chloroplastic [Nelumbo nucifera]